ncbi:MAG: hypothetical protein HQL42_09565 [Alphaproteobacteria bacterium]|nr:hypothetical protein [Alphaproteobacteria bacterium]
MAGLVVLGSPSAVAGCPDAAQVTAHVAEFAAKIPSRGFGKTITEADAQCALGRLIPELPPVLGPRVGYKALFTNPDSQKRFGVAGQMVTSGAVVPANFGARPRYEADFVVVVKDAALVPFVELPDLMTEGTPTGQPPGTGDLLSLGGVQGSDPAVTVAFAGSP